MKIPSLLILAGMALFLTGPAWAETLDDANRAFAAGQYHDSTVGYQAVLAQNGYSAPVLFDLGNSYYRGGDLTQAILAYQRAQWLAPNDPDIAANLQFAQKQAGLPVTESPWYEKLGSALNASEWAWIACGAWTLLCVSLLLRPILPQRQSLFSLSSALSALLILAASAAAFVQSNALHQAVVIDKNATALISPFPAAQTVFSPPAGATVAVQKAYDDFLLVKDSAGHTGWISKTQIAPIIPPHSNG